MTADRDLKVVGRSVTKQDALGLACGQARFTDDVVIPGLTHAKVLGSPHPHARIAAIDTSRAEALPGVGSMRDDRCQASQTSAASLTPPTDRRSGK